jgi:ribosomal protein S19
MNKKTLKIIICVMLVAILMGSVVFGAGVKKNIEVLFNSVNLTVNGNKVNAETIVYNGTTYVPLRATADMLGKEVGWDQKTNTASINDKISTRLSGLKQRFKDAGFTVGNSESVAYEMLGAKDGVKFNLDNELIEIYEYDMANLSEDIKILIEQAKKGNVNLFGFNIPVKFNDGLILVRYDEHSKANKIVEVFNNYK